MPDLNIGEMVSTTLRNRSGVLADNISNHNALLHKLEKKGNIQPADGGREIIQEIEYAENTTAKWYSGSETLDITAQEVFDAATYDWKQLAGNVTFNGLEQIKNSGRERIINLVQSRIKNLERTLKNNSATAVYANGTGTGGKELGGLQLLVADDPTTSSVVGGIQQSSNVFWQNYFSAAAATTSANIRTRMNTAWLALVRGTDKPDCILADSIMYEYYESALQDLQRFQSEKEASAGFESLMYKTASVLYDDQCPTKHMYQLNTDYLFLRPHPTRMFTALKERESLNQDATVIPVVWAGNLTCSNRKRQGVIIAS